MTTLKETFTQEDLPLILPSKIARTVDLISSETGDDPVALTMKFYASETYARLRDESTKYWWFGPAELKELYCHESRRAGCLEPRLFQGRRCHPACRKIPQLYPLDG